MLLRPLVPRTTTARIGAAVFVAVFVVSAALLVLLEQVTRAELVTEARSRIVAIRAATVAAWARGGRAAAIGIVTGELQVPGPLVLLLVDGSGRPVTGNLRAWPRGLPRDDGFHELPIVHREHAAVEPYLLVTATLPGGHRLAVGRSLEAEARLQRSLASSLVGALVLAVLLSWLTSRYITRLITARAQGIADVVGAVTGGNLAARVDVPPGVPGDAFDSMGLAFNVMLDRLDGLLDELRAVTDGLAHDLRSPLTRLKARIDRLQLANTIDVADLSAIGSEADSLLAMLDNSLEISRAEAGLGRDSFSDIDLAALVTDLAEMYEPLAEDAGVRLVAVAPRAVPVRAHRQLLGRALSNLIDNALRYGAAGGEIVLEAQPALDGVRLVVADRGPGIAAADRAEALRRFGRLDSARRSDGVRRQGAGLGLSLAAAVARLHGGRLVLEDHRPGLKVVIDLPRA